MMETQNYHVGATVRLKPGLADLDTLDQSGLPDAHMFHEERYTPGGTLGEIVSVNYYAGQGWTYEIVYRNGGWVNYLDCEVKDRLEVLFARR